MTSEGVVRRRNVLSVFFQIGKKKSSCCNQDSSDCKGHG